MGRSTLGAVVTLWLLAGACTSKSDGARAGDGAGSGGNAGRGTSGTSGTSGDGGVGGSNGGSAGRATGALGGDQNTGGTGLVGGGSGKGGNFTGATGGGPPTAGRSATGGKGGGVTGGSGGAGGSAGSSPQGGGGGSITTAGEGGEGGAACDLDDEFDGSTLDPCWQVLNGNPSMPLIETEQTGGVLHLSATGNQPGVWYQGATRSLVYQVVTASAFKLTTTAHSRKATDLMALPTKDLHVGGLMVRDPSSMGGDTENYLFIMLGHSEDNNDMVHQGVEFKSTFNGCSNWLEPDWPDMGADGPDADLRICRIGADFRNYKRVPGDPTWILAEAPHGTDCPGNVVNDDVLTRADLPNKLQVGLALNFTAPSDLDVAFEYVHFVELPSNATAEDCTSD